MIFLYNGIELPKLPNRDTAVYPFAAIGEQSSIYYLFLSTAQLTYRNVFPSLWYFDPTEDGETLVYQTTAETMDWEAKDVITFTSGQPVFLMPGTPHWANYDILTPDGTLYLAASDPIPVSTAPAPDPFWMTMGWLVGRAIAGLRGKKETAEPVAYLYNGVRLPKLPEWDRESYPYAVIYFYTATIGSSTTEGYVLDYSVNKFVNEANAISMYPPGVRYQLIDGAGELTTASDGEWSLSGEYTDDGPYSTILNRYSVHWANHDVLYEDGTVFFGGSQPVPVYE